MVGGERRWSLIWIGRALTRSFGSGEARALLSNGHAQVPFRGCILMARPWLDSSICFNTTCISFCARQLVVVMASQSSITTYDMPRVPAKYCQMKSLDGLDILAMPIP